MSDSEFGAKFLPLCPERGQSELVLWSSIVFEQCSSTVYIKYHLPLPPPVLPPPLLARSPPVDCCGSTRVSAAMVNRVTSPPTGDARRIP